MATFSDYLEGVSIEVVLVLFIAERIRIDVVAMMVLSTLALPCSHGMIVVSEPPTGSK